MNFDVVIVGAGPSGLTMGIRLSQLALEQERELTICILEKGAEVGAHILSGAVVEPRTLTELIPDWNEKGAPLNVAVKSDQFKFLTASGSISMPTPPQMHNEGNYIVSLGNVCRWLGEQAEEMEVNIFLQGRQIDTASLLDIITVSFLHQFTGSLNNPGHAGFTHVHVMCLFSQHKLTGACKWIKGGFRQ